MQLNFYLLLARILIRSNNFEKLKYLLQYHVIPDSVEMTVLLVALSKSTFATFQLAIDMMHRLKVYDKLIEALIDKSYFFEALQAISIRHHRKWILRIVRIKSARRR